MIVTQAPLRVSFFGGGTDLPSFYEHIGQGQVLTSAIGLSVHVVVQPRWDDRVCAHYTRRELVDDASEVEHDLIREALLLTGVRSGVEVTTLADVPGEGTGLGSSSSITVALLAALYAYTGRTVSRRCLAEQACEIEIERLGKVSGKQDQFIAAYGGVRRITFDTWVKAHEVRVSLEEIDRLEDRLLMFYTGRTRQSSMILAEQAARTTEHAGALRSMVSYAIEGERLLLRGNLDGFGELLDTAWQVKRSLASGVSTSEIDALYHRARGAGALGGKVCGAGGGGFLLLYARPERQRDIRAALDGLREVRASLGAPGCRIVYSDAPARVGVLV